MRYHIYRRKKDNLYYFQFKTDEGHVILSSQTYQDKDACVNGIRSVLKNAKDKERYESISKDGKFHFILKAANHQEIGKSEEFDTVEDRDEAIDLCLNMKITSSVKSKSANEETPKVAKATPTPSGDVKDYKGTETKSKEGQDDYKPLAFYESHKGDVETGFASFDSDTNDDSYFAYCINGAVILLSEGYNSPKSRDNGIKSVTKNMNEKKRYERKIHTNGKYYFNLKAGNHQEIATSRWFDNERDRDDVIAMLLSGGGSMVSSSKAVISSSEEPKKKRKKKEKKPAPERTYLSQDQGYLFNNVKYDTFQSGGNHRYYFLFKNEEGKAVLINGDVRGIETTDELESTIKEVFKYAPDRNNYHVKETKTGKYYFYIKNSEDKNIARGSLFFKTKEDMEAAIIPLLGSVAAVKASGPASSGSSVDEYLPCQSYKKDVGFASFVHEANGEFYFSYNNDNGKTLLRSEGYSSAAGRDNGIQSVIKNAPEEKRWSVVEEGGHFCFVLKAGNHQEIARSCPYDSQAAAEADLVWIRGEHSQIGAGAKMVGATMLSAFMIRKKEEENAARLAAEAEAKRKAAETARLKAEAEAKAKAEEAARLKAEEEAKAKAAAVDEYLPCEDYKKDAGFISFVHEANGEFYFSYNNSTGKTLLRSEGYTNAAGRDNGIQSVIKNAPEEKRWSIVEEDGHFYFRLKAGNHQEIARSCAYSSQAAAEIDLAWIRGEHSQIGAGSKMVGATMLSAFMIRKKEEEETARLAAAEAKRKAEEAARLKAEAEAKAKAKAEEAARLKAEAEAKVKATRLAAEAANKKPIDDYLPCEAYGGKGKAGFYKFQDAKTKEYYFGYNDDDGNTMLRSEGYTTQAARDNGIESVKKNAPIKERWKKATAMDGKYHYYILKAGNHQEIARSCYSKSEDGMNTSFLMLAGAFAPVVAATKLVEKTEIIEKVKAVPTPPPAPKEKEDDYLPCKEYVGYTINDKQNNVALFKHDNGQFYFAIYNKDGSVRLRSEGFGDAKERDIELSGVLKNLNNKEMYTRITKGKHFIDVLKDKTGREVGRTCIQSEKPVVVAPKEKEDDYLPCKEYVGHRVNDKQNNVALFKHDNGQFYFAIYNKDGSVRLRSEGFRDAKERDIELSGVLKNLNNKKMYTRVTRGKHYIDVLKDKTGREVGRTCLQKEKKKVAAIIPPVVIPPKKKVVAPVVLPPVKKEKKKVVAAAAAAPVAAAAAGGSFWGKLWPWLLGLLLLAALLYFLKGCDGCNTDKAAAPITKVEKPTKEEKVVEPDPVPTAYCDAVSKLGLDKGVEAEIAKFLSEPGKGSKRFTLSTQFARNSAKISSGNTQISNLAELCRTCPDIQLELYGYSDDNEKSAYKGSKEVSLSDARARAVYRALTKKEIAENRVSFEGMGADGKRRIEVLVTKR